ncbi:LOG family protein [Azospirillum sp. TSO22-1]|uniref:LOG family protein n=1 Tax=Azospirillum sp. TSO22-1 TaxID=716789 RepID=UPI000D611FAA|nr:LOG family protein [Azospirillum sp. TSO22-1]PWC38496.1 3-isopropylmalate dehydrogenase [Azospirillum sp. TSO22-1]
MPDSPRPNHHSSSFRLAFEDRDFLLSPSMRGVRFMLEYSKPEEIMQAWGVRSTIVVFGSARVPSPEKAAELRANARTPEETRLAELRTEQVAWYEEARRFARLVSEKGGALAPDENGMRDNVIATGGGPGLMEAANRGASEAGAPSIGYNIVLPFEEHPNPYSTPDLTFRFHYFAIRKMHLAMRANALAVFPGGFGTLDEAFEILNLQNTNKATRLPIVLVGTAFWNEIVNFDALSRHGMISPIDLDRFDIVDTAEEAWETILKRGLKRGIPPLGPAGTGKSAEDEPA